MSFNFDKIIKYKMATILGILLCLPFLFAFTTAITGFKPLLDLIAYNGRATPLGLVLFYIAMIGLPLAFAVNTISMLSGKISLSRWSIESKISFHPKLINLTIAVISLLVTLVFGGHLIIDAIACLYGNISACD